MVVFVVAQVKKDEVRTNILEAAEALFRERGYNVTTMTAIADTAAISKSNIYVYFASKLEIVWALSDSWLRESFDRLESRAQAISNKQEQLRFLFRALWCDLPADRDNFANNIMQALTTTTEDDGYSRDLLAICEARFAGLLANALGTSVANTRAPAHIALKAFDGYAIAHNLGSGACAAAAASDAMADLLYARYG